MKDYIKRLIKCGYTEQDAIKTCVDFLRNLHNFELQFFVESTERKINVD